ncbi:MAG: alkaline phosphatase family protein [Oscillospiraceae bacterium]|nr:alkaline phosphatase family protein [Oscillospiraceae bacterium]
MKKFILALLAVVLVAVGLVGCTAPVQPLPLLGDATPLTFNAREYALADVIDARAQEFSLLAIAHDGFAVQLRGDELDGVRLRYRNGWQLHAPEHPPSANVRDIAQLVVVSEGDDLYTVRLIDADEHVREITAGQLFLQPHRQHLFYEGTSYAHTGRNVTVLTALRAVPLYHLLAGNHFAAMARNGETVYFRGQGYLMSEQNHVSLQLPDGRVLRDIVGIMAEPPGVQITQLFHDAMHFIAQDEQVLAIKIDGLGWDMLEHAPFISSLNPQRALAVFPPITPTGLASMLTGKTPDAHGITGRGQRNLLIDDDIFALVPGSVHIGARNSFFNTSLSPQLTTSDADGFMLAQQALAQPADFTFVHFKQVDSTAHYYGPQAEQTQRAIAEIDDFVRLLAEQFDGRIIITSDHGLHETADGGNHGLFLPQDMLVPYVVR